MMKEVENRSWNSLGTEEREKRGGVMEADSQGCPIGDFVMDLSGCRHGNRSQVRAHIASKR